MTKKSASRLARDAKTRRDAGVPQNTRFNREKSSRSWYELKMVHNRSIEYVKKTAQHFALLTDPRVLARIAEHKNGPRFLELNKEAAALAATFDKRLNDLWDQHKDKRKLCLSHTELTEAFRLFEAYQLFDVDYYTEFSHVINQLNEMWNSALMELLAEQNAAEGSAVTDLTLNNETPAPFADDPSIPKHVPAEELISAAHEKAKDQEDVGVDPKIGRGLIRPIMEFPAVDEPAVTTGE